MSGDRRVVASAAAVIAVSIGTLVLAGWVIDADGLKSLHPALASMKANTASAFLMAGVALWIRRHDGARIGLVGRASAIIVLLIGGATLVEYCAGIDLHIDRLVFTDDASHDAPGRMAFASAAGLSLIGVALLAIDARTKRGGRPAQWLALLGGVMAFVVLVGYVYGVEALYRTSTFTSISPHTALTILVLCVGILYARPTVGIMRVMTLQGSPTSAVVRRLAPVMILLPILFGWLRPIGERAGLYHFELGLALFALSNVIVISGLLWWTCASQLRWELAARDANEELYERGRAELAAQRVIVASEERYRDLYESSPDMYLTADLATETITDCNQTLCNRLGYDRQELLGQPFRTVYHSDYQPDVEAQRAAFQETGDFIDVERRLRCKDGSSVEVSLNLRGIRDASGKMTAARAVWRDITRRKQADRDRQFLVQLGDEFRSSIEPTEVLVAVSRRLGEYLQASRCSFAEIDSDADRVTAHAGYQRGVASVAGILSLSIFGPVTAAACLRGETVVVADTATDVRTAALFDVSYRRVSVHAYVLAPMLREHRWVACLSVSSDKPRAWEDRESALVTLVAERVWLWIEHLRVLAELRQRDVNEAIRHTEARFRALVDGVKDYAIFMLDLDGNVATWNAGAERLKGYRSEEITGKHLGVFSTLEDRESEHSRFMLERARRDGRFEEEGWRLRKDGSRFWASVLLTALYDRDGRIDGFAKITRDFTDRRNQDEALRAKQAALVQSLKEREVLLQEVHHRVKNNLQVISSLINMQVRKLDDGSTRDALVECQTRVQTIALIHEKLYQSKDYSRVRFADYARSLAANVFHATGTSPGNVTLELAIDEVPLGVDLAIPCGLVINELITNSLKHGLRDGRSGTIRVELKKIDDGRLRLTVRDDGAGLPAGFDIHKNDSMGLQLVCTLAEQLDATLVVNGERGASFELTFRGGD